jgi:hypothetical protein
MSSTYKDIDWTVRAYVCVCVCVCVSNSIEEEKSSGLVNEFQF